MLAPENWLEYRWFYRSGTADATIAVKSGRVWRITATAGGTGGTINIDGNTDTILVPANSTLVLEPKGMLPFAEGVSFAGMTSYTVEWIRRL